MEQIKLAIFDIDGTLLKWGSNTIEESTVKAIHQLKEKGIEVLVATGRAFYFIKPHVREVLDCDYFVTINGGCLLNIKGEIIKEHPISNEDVQFVIDLVDKYKASMATKTSKEMIVYKDYDHFAHYYGQGFQATNLFIDDTKNRNYHKTCESAKGIFIYSDDRDEIVDKLRENKNIIVHAVGDFGIDVFSKESDKIHGIEEVLEMNQLTWANTIAFGDENNDLLMIKKAQIGVAMGNGSEDMKAVADYVTSNVDEGGIYQALRHFKLI